jgi:hypothetical protein
MNTTKLDALKRALALAQTKEAEAVRECKDAEKAYAFAKAESVGIHIGSIITTSRKEGHGRRGKVVTRRYRVCSIAYCDYHQDELTLWGITIRKDGSDGEKHEIWQDWQKEESYD